MKPPCPNCGHTHTATDTHALRRFEEWAEWCGGREATRLAGGRLVTLTADAGLT